MSTTVLRAWNKGTLSWQASLILLPLFPDLFFRPVSITEHDTRVKAHHPTKQKQLALTVIFHDIYADPPITELPDLSPHTYWMWMEMEEFVQFVFFFVSPRALPANMFSFEGRRGYTTTAAVLYSTVRCRDMLWWMQSITVVMAGNPQLYPSSTERSGVCLSLGLSPTVHLN